MARVRAAYIKFHKYVPMLTGKAFSLKLKDTLYWSVTLDEDKTSTTRPKLFDAKAKDKARTTRSRPRTRTEPQGQGRGQVFQAEAGHR